MNIKTVTITLLVVLTLGLGFALPSLWQSLTKPQVDLSQYCMLSEQVCQQGEVKVKLDTHHVNPLTPAPLEVFWPNSASDTLMMSLEGLEMAMGEVKVKLNMIKPDIYQGDILLPVCSETSMTWYGTITASGTSTDTDGRQTVKIALRMQER